MAEETFYLGWRKKHDIWVERVSYPKEMGNGCSTCMLEMGCFSIIMQYSYLLLGVAMPRQKVGSTQAYFYNFSLNK